MNIDTRKVASARLVKVAQVSTRRIDPLDVANELGGDVSVGERADYQGSVAKTALHRQILARLSSSGGRPGLGGATRRQKIPLTESDWSQFKALSAELRRAKCKVSAGQIASELIHAALQQMTAAKPASSAPSK